MTPSLWRLSLPPLTQKPPRTVRSHTGVFLAMVDFCGKEDYGGEGCKLLSVPATFPFTCISAYVVRSYNPVFVNSVVVLHLSGFFSLIGYLQYCTVPQSICMYLEYHSVCPLVRIGTPPPPLPLASVFPPRVTKRCLLTRLTIIAPSYMGPNAGGGGKLWGLSQWVQLYTGAQINFGDLTPYLTYGSLPRDTLACGWGSGEGPNSDDCLLWCTTKYSTVHLLSWPAILNSWNFLSSSGSHFKMLPQNILSR